MRQCRLPLLRCLTTDVTTNMSMTEDGHGQVDGRPVKWHYQRPENDQVGNFSWTEGDGKAECKYLHYLV